MHACLYTYVHIHVPFSRVGLSPFCSGEANFCKAVTSANLTLNCSSCSSANTVMWKRGSSQSLPYNTYIAQIPARDVQPDASGCYTCVCDGNSYSFAVDIRAAGRYIPHTGKISSWQWCTTLPLTWPVLVVVCSMYIHYCISFVLFHYIRLSPLTCKEWYRR